MYHILDEFSSFVQIALDRWHYVLALIYQTLTFVQHELLEAGVPLTFVNPDHFVTKVALDSLHRTFERECNFFR